MKIAKRARYANGVLLRQRRFSVGAFVVGVGGEREEGNGVLGK